MLEFLKTVSGKPITATSDMARARSMLLGISSLLAMSRVSRVNLRRKMKQVKPATMLCSSSIVASTGLSDTLN